MYSSSTKMDLDILLAWNATTLKEKQTDGRTNRQTCTDTDTGEQSGQTRQTDLRKMDEK